jgi:GrpB-like predicted nucleotidyltransferase (UPF0157 family)
MPEASIEVVPYRSDWPGLFDTEAKSLAVVLSAWLAGDIEHIGSTAVPGLAAKPVIDIMAPVHDLATAIPAIAALRALDYVHFPYKPDEMHWFCKPSPAHRTHHLHLVPFGSAPWRKRLLFRDALRRDAALAAAYARLKHRLASGYPHDREAYTDGKAPFIQSVLGAALDGPSTTAP